MKLLLPLALLASSAAAASCDAENIVKACLESTQAKFDACGQAEYDCLCAAQEAIATCYNNCPDDPAAGDAQGQVQIHCENASVFGSAASAPTQSGSGSTDSAAEPTTTDSESGSDSDSDSDSNSDSNSASEGDEEDVDGAAADLALNMGGLLVGVAGVMAIVV